MITVVYDINFYQTNNLKFLTVGPYGTAKVYVYFSEPMTKKYVS